MLPTRVRQPALRMQRGPSGPVKAQPHLAGWCSGGGLGWSRLCLKWLLWLHSQESECPPCPHCPTASSPKSHPGAKPDMEIPCTKHLYNVMFLPAPAFCWPASGAKACAPVGAIRRADVPQAELDGRAMGSPAVKQGRGSCSPPVWSHHCSALLSSLGEGGMGPRTVGTSPWGQATTLWTQPPLPGSIQPSPTTSCKSNFNEHLSHIQGYK